MWSRGATACALMVFAALALSGCAGKRVEPGPGAGADAASVAGADAYSRGDYARALAAFRESLRINRTLDDRRAEARDLVNIGRARVMLGEPEAAVAGLEEAAEAALALDDGGLQFQAMLTLAKARYLAGDAAGAEEDLARSLELAERLGLPTAAALNMKGRLLMDAGRHAEAARSIERALKRAGEEDDPLEEANSLRGLAALASMGYHEGPAMELFERAYELDRAAGSPRKIASDLAGMARLYRQGGRAAQAAYLLERAYLVSSSAGLTEDALGYLEELVPALAEAGDEAGAERYGGMLMKGRAEGR